MTLEHLAGRSYGPFPVEVSAGKSAELVAATGDDPDRWRRSAPPSYAATLLFAAAPRLFDDPDVARFTGALIHNEQQFAWDGPLAVGATLDVTATVESVRARRGLNLVSFVVRAGDVLTSTSSFVMAEAAEPPAGVADEPEPAVAAKAADEPPVATALPGPGEPLPALSKSASRADLVRYAAATGDFNPIHWDHESARRAGLPGVIAHGLLMAAWLTQAAGRFVPGRDDPLAHLRVRFRRFLRPAVAAVVSGAAVSATEVDLAVEADDHALVTGKATLRAG